MNVRSWLKFLIASSLALYPKVAFQAGLKDAAGVGGIGVIQNTDLPTAVGRIINILLMLAGLVAVIYLIYGGVQYITSRGDEDQATDAKNTILFALLGLIIIGLAVVLVNYILGAIFAA